MRLVWRLLFGAVIVCLLFGSFVHYGAVADEHSPYPTTEELDANYGTHVGETVLLFGDVISVSETADRARIRVSTSTGSFEMSVTRFRERVQPGGVVQVYGVLQSGRTVVAKNVEVVNPAGSSKTYKYAVSVVGALLVLVLFFREWRFDLERYALEVRSDG